MIDFFAVLVIRVNDFARGPSFASVAFDRFASVLDAVPRLQWVVPEDVTAFNRQERRVPSIAKNDANDILSGTQIGRDGIGMGGHSLAIFVYFRGHEMIR